MMRSRSLLWSFNYAIEGIVYALRTQRNMRIHVAAALLVLGGSLFFRISRLEFIAVLFAIVFVFVAELVNTAVEAAVDVATQSFDPIAKVAKDVAAGAVFVASVNAVVVGYVVFFAPIGTAGEFLLTRVRQTPTHVTIIALLLTSLGVLVGKAITRKGTYMRGGWPSGHTATAAAAATAIAYFSESAGIGALAAFIAFLVGQSRVENGAHTWPQVIVGGVLGFLITTAVFQVSWV
ncbi:MAG TPA: diacylglycerol kinase [Coriobacteriia bacterium]|nr:MAG: Diacylglycerol kinase [Actinobacteria bacterium 66_15]HAL30591.1 diacylglycerol kinase [Coriobacteriia bacterium]